MHSIDMLCMTVSFVPSSQERVVSAKTIHKLSKQKRRKVKRID